MQRFNKIDDILPKTMTICGWVRGFIDAGVDGSSHVLNKRTVDALVDYRNLVFQVNFNMCIHKRDNLSVKLFNCNIPLGLRLKT